MAPRPGAPFAVAFDLDGTLVDSRADIIAAVRHAMTQFGAPVTRSDAEIAAFVGDGARLLMARVFDLAVEDPKLDPLLDAYITFYEAHAADHTTLMPGAAEALDAFAGVPLAICSNKPRGPTERVLEALGVGARFTMIVAGGDVPHPKPHPESLLRIARKLELQPSALVMVGDGVQDIECGKNVGARTIAVLGGFGAESALRASNPDALLASLHELPSAVATLRR